MSDKQATETLKYYERVNMPVLSISKIKELIKDDIKQTLNIWEKHSEIEIEKQCWHIVGPAGVGKTAICFQIAEELSQETGKKFDIIKIQGPVLSRDDFIIPFPVKNKEGEISDFRMLYSDFVPKGDGYGIFLIDEFSRADHTLQQLLWQVQNECSIHLRKFPKGWFIISVDNPDDAEYQMDTMEDAAGLRRQLHIYTEVNAIDFLQYAIKHKFHPYVIEFIQTHNERIYDFEAQKRGMIYANPASYEKLSNHLWKMESSGGIDFEKIEQKAAGLLNVNMAQLFIEFARDKKDINPRDVFENFQRVKPDIQKLITENNNSKLSELMSGFCAYLTTSMPTYSNRELDNILNFLLVMPIDTAALFVSQVDKFDRKSEAFKYITKIHAILMANSNKYKTEFYEPVVACSEGKLLTPNK
jgi:GTPase SAR1 family protein